MHREINFIQYLKSFFADVPIESAKGIGNTQLEVALSSGKFKLNTGNATYSFEDKYTSYRTALKQINNEINPAGRALVLGTGLGSIPYMLIGMHNYKGEILCIDIDGEIIRLAKKYFPEQPIPNQIHFIEEDAMKFVQENKMQFDLIAVDLFIDVFVPDKFHEKEFLENIKTRLAPKGILLFSRLKSNLSLEKKLNDNLRDVFRGATDIDTGGNLILCWKAPK